MANESKDKPEKGKEKTAKTKPMPLDAAPDFTEWAKKQLSVEP